MELFGESLLDEDRGVEGGEVEDREDDDKEILEEIGG